ncbi:MAG: hypothetical protein R3E89_09090 [Thiolinea sp.]
MKIFAAGLLDRAESVFRELISKYPQNTRACEPLRHIYEQLQDWDKAIELSRCLATDRPDRNRLIAHYYCEQAEHYLQQNHLYQADENLRHALDSYPQSARVNVLQAELALARSERDKALDSFLQAIRKDRRLLGALTGRLLETFQEPEELDRLYEAIHDLYLDTRDVLYFPALLNIAQVGGRQAETLPLIRMHLQDDPLTLHSVASSARVLTDNQVTAEQAMPLLDGGLKRLAKANARFICMQCGYKMHEYLWRCPACRQWDSVQNS